MASGAGKSSLTKEVAQTLGLLHIDSGALYRTVALIALEKFQQETIVVKELLAA